MSRYAKIFGLGLAGVAVLLLVVVAGAIPVPVAGASAEPGDPARAVRIYVLSNGFHSDIAVPAQDGRALEAMDIEQAAFPVDMGEVRYWAFGWGSRTAYTSLVDVSDLTLGIAARALAFDETVMHVLPLRALTAGDGVYAYDISPAAFERLLSGLRNSFGDDLRPIPGITQGFGDRFFRARGQFSPWRPCNVWTGQQLRAIGIGLGVWTPFARSLEFGLERTANGT